MTTGLLFLSLFSWMFDDVLKKAWKRLDLCLLKSEEGLEALEGGGVHAACS